MHTYSKFKILADKKIRYIHICGYWLTLCGLVKKYSIELPMQKKNVNLYNFYWKFVFIKIVIIANLSILKVCELALALLNFALSKVSFSHLLENDYCRNFDFYTFQESYLWNGQPAAPTIFNNKKFLGNKFVCTY